MKKPHKDKIIAAPDKIELSLVKTQPNQFLIAELKKLLALAESGKMVSLASVVEWHNSYTANGYVLRHDIPTRRLLGEMAILNQLLIDKVEE